MKKLVAAAQTKKDALVAAIYASVGNDSTPFNDCYRAATQELRQAYDQSVSRLIEAEQAAISSGKAWRSSFGMITFNR